MRPVRRGASPSPHGFADFTEAKPHLISRLGPYCNYCERRVPTQLAVEHIQPKGPSCYAHLITEWSNLLLGCVNCNSTKKDKDVALADIFMPDRDNTFCAFQYTKDGKVGAASGLSIDFAKKAKDTLALTGLDKPISSVLDENGKQIAIERVGQRMEVWLMAEDAKSEVDNDPGNQALRRQIVKTAKASGFFSIWMTVFQQDADMLNRLIDAFPGTRASACFDGLGHAVSPAPNPDSLPNGGKI